MEVKVYSRGVRVQLWLNQKLIREVAAGEQLTTVFSIPYSRGNLTAVAIEADGQAGRASSLPLATPPSATPSAAMAPSASATLLTAARAAALRLVPDREVICADPNDLAYVSVELVDEHGVRFPSSEFEVSFDVEGDGDLYRVGSGAPRDLDSFTAPRRTTYLGRALAVLRPTGSPGAVTLRASARGVTPATVSITTVAGECTFM